MAAFSMSHSLALPRQAAPRAVVRSEKSPAVTPDCSEAMTSCTPNCLTAGRAGSPEIMTLVYKAVKRGYAIVALGAHRGGDKWRCFETHWPPEDHEELPGVCT